MSDLGRVSYHSYWKSVVLEYLARVRGRGHITIQQLSAETALHPHDIALAFMLLGFIKKQAGNKFLLSIDWAKVDSHMEKVKRTLRIAMDPDSLRWSPTPPAGILFDSPLKSEPGSDSEDSDIEDVKETSSKLTVVTEQRRGPGRPRKSEAVKTEERQEDSELEIKIGGGRRQILSTESESECVVNTGTTATQQRSSKRVSQSGECAGTSYLSSETNDIFIFTNFNFPFLRAGWRGVDTDINKQTQI